MILFALVGIGFIVYLLFAAATYSLPLMAAVLVGFAMRSSGAPGASPLIVAFLAFIAVSVAGKAAMALLPYRFVRIAIMLIFMVPAAIFGFQLGNGMLTLAGVHRGVIGVALALIVATVSALIAAERLAPQPHG